MLKMVYIWGSGFFFLTILLTEIGIWFHLCQVSASQVSHSRVKSDRLQFMKFFLTLKGITECCPMLLLKAKSLRLSVLNSEFMWLKVTWFQFQYYPKSSGKFSSLGARSTHLHLPQRLTILKSPNKKNPPKLVLSLQLSRKITHLGWVNE